MPLGRADRFAGAPHPRATDLRLLCALLESRRLPTWAKTALSDEDAWLRIASEANFQRVGAYLDAALHRHGVVPPPEFGGYARLIRQRNECRNRALADQMVEIAHDLNGAGIIPMLLKGSAFIIERGRGSDGRMPVDIDFMVEQHQFERAMAVLHATGYEETEAASRWLVHARNLFRPDRLAPVDIHRTFGRQRRMLPPELAWQSAQPVTIGGARMLMPTPTHRLFHAIFHAELQSRFHSLARLSVQMMLDVEALTERANSDAVLAMFDSEGLRHVGASALHAADELLGVRIDLARRDREIGRRHLAQAMRRLDHRGLRRLRTGTWILTQPLSRFNLGYRFQCEDDLWRLRLLRIAYPIVQAAQLRGQMPRKVADLWRSLSPQVP